ncbi:MAG: hypothetical protein ACXADH_15130 [Candidatus Kariarchaeaceae archaeon]|jgi:hypothetical protein
MGQISKTKSESTELDAKTGDLKSRFEETKNKREAYRTVILKFESCCGCGCNTTNVKRVVPADSNLQDGDLITDLHDDDEIL